MPKMEVRWEEGGESYSVRRRLFSSWVGAARFEWYPMDATLIKCKIIEGDVEILRGPDGSIVAVQDDVIRDLKGRVVGRIELVHRERVAMMLPIEELISMGVTELVEGDG